MNDNANFSGATFWVNSLLTNCTCGSCFEAKWILILSNVYAQNLSIFQYPMNNYTETNINIIGKLIVVWFKGCCPTFWLHGCIIWIKSRSTASTQLFDTQTNTRWLLFFALCWTRQSWAPNIDRSMPEIWPWPVRAHTDGQMDDGWMDGHYQVHYLPASLKLRGR